MTMASTSTKRDWVVGKAHVGFFVRHFCAPRAEVANKKIIPLIETLRLGRLRALIARNKPFVLPFPERSAAMVGIGECPKHTR